ncbi:hypothetical protein L6452_01939 [Arctium lappa]|uniref:Uncharacterized protein n=1 Tax=Arctium lappa TaxID=4217 RepID=A0ACB9FIV1_ARCLA|nr:hypothetical protein L6452_01939 [Arctium lappa]
MGNQEVVGLENLALDVLVAFKKTQVALLQVVEVNLENLEKTQISNLFGVEIVAVITIDRIQQQSKQRGPKSISNRTRVVPPPEPVKPKGVQLVQSEKQQHKLEIMEEDLSMDRRFVTDLDCNKLPDQVLYLLD